MDNKKLWAILIIIIALIILIGLVYFMYLAPVAEEPAPEPTPVVIEQEVGQEPAPETTTVKKRVIPEAEVTEEELKKISASFIERFGTYSNQAGYNNIKELKLFMSTAMQGWADSYIEEIRRRNADTSIYYGLTTKAVVVEATSFSAGATAAEFLVKTQRKETIGATGNIRTFQQDAVLKMVKEGGAWKVDRVVWQE